MSLKNVVMVLLLLTITLSAQNEIKKTGGVARLKSMGENTFMLDPTNILINPAYGAYYDNFIWGDIGLTGSEGSSDGIGQYLGSSIRLNDDFSIGLLLSNSDHTYGDVSIMSVDPFNFGNKISPNTPTPQNNTELFGTYKMKNTILGLGMSYSVSGVDQKQESIEPPRTLKQNRNYRQFGLDLGFITNLSDGIKLDASVMFLAVGSTYETDSLCIEGSQSIFKINSRAFIKLNDKINFIPMVGFYATDGSFEYTKKPQIGTYENFDVPSNTYLNLGIGFDYVNSDLYIVGGPSISFDWVKYESKNSGINTKLDQTNISLTWKIGLEWLATNWLTGRLGYRQKTTDVSKNYINGNIISESNETYFEASDGFTLGIGLKFDNFSLDATINEDMIRQGLRMIGGDYNTLGYVSLSYAF